MSGCLHEKKKTGMQRAGYIRMHVKQSWMHTSGSYPLSPNSIAVSQGACMHALAPTRLVTQFCKILIWTAQCMHLGPSAYTLDSPPDVDTLEARDRKFTSLRMSSTSCGASGHSVLTVDSRLTFWTFTRVAQCIIDTRLSTGTIKGTSCGRSASSGIAAPT